MRIRNILLGTTLTVAAWLAAANSIGVQARYEDDVEEYSALVAGDTLPVQAKVEHAQKQLNAISLFSVAAKQSAEAKVDEKKSSEYLLDNLLATAYKYLGVRYRSGHSGPDGFDCSGFTSYVYKNFGYSLSHSAIAQSKVGTYIEKENLQPGDLVFFLEWDTMDEIGHCGIYIGNILSPTIF